MAVYLNYLDRELGQSVGFRLTPETFIFLTNQVLFFSYESVYSGLSLLWEQPAAREAGEYLRRLLLWGQLETLTAYASPQDFLYAKRVEYAHQVERYPAYFDPAAQADILGFSHFRQVRTRATDILVRDLSIWAQTSVTSFEDLPLTERGKASAAVMVSLEKRGNRAVTFPLFQREIERRKLAEPFGRRVAREISTSYTKHYRGVLSGVAPTGVAGLSHYDEIAGSFPYLDYPILGRVSALLGCPPVASQSLELFLATRGTATHVQFVRAVRGAIARACPADGDLYQRRSVVIERLAEASRRLPSRSKRQQWRDWSQFFLAAAELAQALAREVDSRDLAGSLYATGEGGGGLEVRETVDILIVTVTDAELEAVLQEMRPLKENFKPEFYGANTFFRGTFVGHEAAAVRCEPGSSGRDASILVVEEMIRAVQPRAVLMLGIAFGADETRQKLGDVLVSRYISVYEPQRVGTDAEGKEKKLARGPRVPAGTVLFNRFRDCARGWSVDKAKIHYGIILSGEKLVDNLDFKRELLEIEPEAKGGEMEGAGLFAAADRRGVEWIVVKAICDWGDGKKKDDHHALAAGHSVSLAAHVLRNDDVLRGCRRYSSVVD